MFKKFSILFLCAVSALLTAETVSTIPQELLDSARLKPSKNVLQRLTLLEQEKSAFIKEPLISIVHNKVLTAPTGDPHDYISVGPYFFPDPTKPDGKPWIEKDGQFNPDRHKYDNGKLAKMSDRVEICALLWHCKGDKEAASYAIKQLNCFFISPETKMNPHLRFGQSVPGKVDGRPAGMIDTLNLLKVIDAVAMLRNHQEYTPELHANLQKWFAAYAHWMRTDKMARKDWPVKQNHGLSYHTQIAAYLAFSGNTNGARGHINILKKRITQCINADGVQPAEVRRTNGWSYSNYALMILMQSAGIAKNLGVNMFDPKEKNCVLLLTAVDYLTKYIKPEEKWPYREIAGFSANRLSQILSQVYYYTGNRKYLDYLKDIRNVKIRENRVVCFFLQHDEVIAK